MSVPQYLHSLGYCPQFFGLDSFLSGHDNLALLLTLKGLSQDDVEREVDTWIRIVGQSCEVTYTDPDTLV